MMERQKTKAMVAKCQKAKRRISSFSKNEENYENNTENKTDSNQTDNDKNLL